MVQMDNEVRGRNIKRPKWVWVITIFYIFSVAFTTYSFIAISSGLVPLNEAQQTAISDLGYISYTTTIISSLLALSGAISLFLLKKITLKIWVLVFIFEIMINLHSALTSDYFDTVETSGLIGSLIGFGIIGAIYFYAKKLDNRGYLR